jgi:serine/threonine protein kinase
MTVPAGTRYGVYEIIAPLGAGGMGVVYKARDPRLDRLVALKILPGDFANDATARERFEREARTASALNHPNILSVFDVGRDAGAEYLVTELVDGTTLRENLAAGPLPPREVVRLGAQIADGLATAHGAGLIHRDLKPENVMVTRDGRVKILDSDSPSRCTIRSSGKRPAPPSPTPVCWSAPSATSLRSRCAASQATRARICSRWALCYTR